MRPITIMLALAIFVSRGFSVTTLRLAHGLNTDHPVHSAMIYMANAVKEKSNGELIVEVYPNEQLGNEKECIEAIQLGYLAMTKISTAAMESFVPKFKIFGLPYLFRDSDHFWNVCNGEIGKELLLSGESKRLRGLCYYDAGARSFYAHKSINSPADLNVDGGKLRVRVMGSPMASELIATMGGTPSTISWGELYTSLDQGRVDAAENNPPSYLSSRHYEITKFYSLDEHVRLPDLLVISTRVWAKLTEQEREMLQEAADESVLYQRKLWIKSEEEAMIKVKEAGVTVTYPDKTPFVEAVQPMWDKYKDTELGPLLKKIREVK